MRAPTHVLRPQWVLACWLILLASPTVAAGQDGGAEAEQLFRDGKRLMKEGNYAEACDAFATSQKLDPTVSTLANLADCREKGGQFASAWNTFLEVERQTRGDKNQAKLNKTARDRATKLESRLSFMTVSVPMESQIDGLELTRNGEAFDAGLWNRAIPVDGGEYTIGGRAPGHEQWSTTVTVPAENGRVSVDVPRFKAVEEIMKAPDGPSDNPTPNDEPRRLRGEAVDQPPVFTGRRKIAVAVAGVGLLALAGGAVLGLQTNDLRDRAATLCPETACGAKADEANALIARSDRRALFADISFGVAIAAAGAATVLWLSGAPTREPRASALVPVVTADGAGMAIVGGF